MSRRSKVTTGRGRPIGHVLCGLGGGGRGTAPFGSTPRGDLIMSLGVAEQNERYRTITKFARYNRRNFLITQIVITKLKGEFSLTVTGANGRGTEIPL